MKTITQVLLAGIAVSGIATAGPEARFGAIVAADGSGTHTTVQSAIDDASKNTSSKKPWTILVKPGTYKEHLYVQREKHFVRLIGEDPEKTVITYNLFASMKGPDGNDIGTFRTPSVQIDADDFTVEKLTLENSAGPVGQALALRVDGDRVAFRNCRFVGFQDTILLNRGRQYFDNCTITGAVDFIFGGATAFFEHCTIHCVRDGYITAASTPAESPHGFVFSNCTITTGPKVRTYLGRPWRPYASTVFLHTRMAEGVRPEGWDNWRNPENEKTARYAEYQNTGPGAKSKARVKWARQLTSKEAAGLTVSKVLGGADSWNPAAR